MPRRFFTGAGEPVEPSVYREFDTLNQAQYETDEHMDPKSEAALNDIDFESLKNIFFEDARRAGVTKNDLNFLEKDAIKTTSHGLPTGEGEVGKGGEYKYVGNIILLDSQALTQLAERWGIPYKLFLLRLLCHEQTHATGLVEHTGVIEAYGDRAEESLSTYGVTQKTGIDTRTYKLVGESFTAHRVFELLEEGIVEKSAQEKFVEYLRRNPDFAAPHDITKFFEVQKTKQNFGIYPATVDMVEIFSGIVSLTTGVSRQTVWHGMKRAHYEGVNLFDPKVYDILTQALDPKLLEQISTAQSERDMANFAHEIYKKLSPKDREACVRWAELYIRHT